MPGRPHGNPIWSILLVLAVGFGPTILALILFGDGR